MTRLVVEGDRREVSRGNAEFGESLIEEIPRGLRVGSGDKRFERSTEEGGREASERWNLAGQGDFAYDLFPVDGKREGFAKLEILKGERLGIESAEGGCGHWNEMEFGLGLEKGESIGRERG